jgi:hypothetical protein
MDRAYLQMLVIFGGVGLVLAALNGQSYYEIKAGLGGLVISAMGVAALVWIWQAADISGRIDDRRQIRMRTLMQADESAATVRYVDDLMMQAGNLASDMQKTPGVVMLPASNGSLMQQLQWQARPVIDQLAQPDMLSTPRAADARTAGTLHHIALTLQVQMPDNPMTGAPWRRQELHATLIAAILQHSPHLESSLRRALSTRPAVHYGYPAAGA